MRRYRNPPTMPESTPFPPVSAPGFVAVTRENTGILAYMLKKRAGGAFSIFRLSMSHATKISKGPPERPYPQPIQALNRSGTFKPPGVYHPMGSGVEQDGYDKKILDDDCSKMDASWL